MSGKDLAVTLTTEQLRELLAAAVRAELATIAASPPKTVMNLVEVAKLLDRNPQTVSKMIERDGLPAHYISEREPRFIVTEVLEWLRNRPSKSKEAA